MGKIRGKPTGKAAAMTDDQKKVAIGAASEGRELAMLLLSLRAGLRAKEIAGLTWADVDLRGKMLLLKATKGDRARTVPMAKELVKAMTAYHATQKGKDGKTRHVFANTHNHPGKPLTPNAVACWFADFYTRRLGWKGFSSHSGRRTFATTVAQKITAAGGSLKDVQELMGHASLQTTQRYIESNPNAQKKVVDL